METEIGMVPLQVEEHRGLLARPELEEAREDSTPSLGSRLLLTP